MGNGLHQRLSESEGKLRRGESGRYSEFAHETEPGVVSKHLLEKLRR